MRLHPAQQEVRQSIRDHVAAKGEEIHQRYPRLGWSELLQLLANPEFVRYPCDLAFESAGLLPGEFAHAEPKGNRPEDGFRLSVHPRFQAELDRVPFLALYHLVTVNYGEFASAEDAEVFGAAALGVGGEDYYLALCRMADELQAGMPGAVSGRRDALGQDRLAPGELVPPVGDDRRQGM